MRLLVIEDDPDLNRQLATALTDAGYVVDRAFDGEEGHYLGETEPYDAVILDIGLPKMDGISVLESWRRAGRAMPVLMLTARDRWSDKVQGFDAGADDYVAKPFHLEEVLARIRALLRRSAGHAKSELNCGPVRLDTRTGRVAVDGNPVKLTSHEYRLLSYLMHHAGRVVSRTELVEHLYDQDFDRDSNTIEVFVGRIRKKLGVDIIQTVRGLGYLSRRRRSRHMRANSLALRLFLSATVWTVLILLVTGFVLSGLYRDSVERAFDRRLGVYLKTLIADLASPDIPIEKTGQMLGEPLFELPLSGWYWQVTRLDRAKPEVTSSRSLWDRGLPHLSEQTVAPDPDGSRKSYVQGPEDQRLRLVERDVDLGDDGRFLVAVGGDASELDDEIARLRRRHRHDLPGAGRGAAAHHAVPGAVRSRAAQPHLARARGDPLRQGREARRLVSRSRSSRWRARPTR